MQHPCYFTPCYPTRCGCKEYSAAAARSLPLEWPELQDRLYSRAEVQAMLNEAYAEGRKDEADEQWQPIETAPIDERILIAATPDWVIEGLVLPESETAMGETVTKRTFHHADGDTLHPNLVPTHWMPLPKLPGKA